MIAFLFCDLNSVLGNLIFSGGKQKVAEKTGINLLIPDYQSFAEDRLFKLVFVYFCMYSRIPK